MDEFRNFNLFIYFTADDDCRTVVFTRMSSRLLIGMNNGCHLCGSSGWGFNCKISYQERDYDPDSVTKMSNDEWNSLIPILLFSRPSLHSEGH